MLKDRKGTRRNKKKILMIYMATLLLLTFFVGCAASKSHDSMSGRSPSQNFTSSPKQEIGIEEDYSGEMLDSSRDAGGQGVVKENIKKVIKNGEIAVEVRDVDAAYKRIIEIIDDIGGEEFNKNFYVSGGYKSMELVLKIPPEQLDFFEEKLKDSVGDGKIKRSNIRSQDITSQYYDYAARLESYRASRDKLKDLLEKAESIEDTLKIHSELTRIQAEIDSMQGQINMWDKLIGMATITLYIDEEANPMKKTTTVGWRFNSPSEIWKTMKNGFISVVNWSYSLLLWLLVAIVSISPILVVVGIVLYFIIHRRKKAKVKYPDN